jgi:hypothetical protein
MDNARIHKGSEVDELIEKFGMLFRHALSFIHLIIDVRLIYLPPYSPDLQPIEEAFSKVKHFIRRNCDVFGYVTTDFRLIYDMQEVFDIITPSDALGYFMHAGYI